MLFYRVFSFPGIAIEFNLDVENRWNTIKGCFCKAAEASLKYQGGNKKSGSSKRNGKYEGKSKIQSLNTELKFQKYHITNPKGLRRKD